MRLITVSIFGSGLLALSACTTNPATGARQLILVSPQDVAAMGLEARPQLVKEYGGEVASPQLRRYVQRVGQKLTEHVEPEFADISWDFITLESDVINAFALPPGNVFISRGLLEQFSNEAQVAAVLAHEIGHITGRHVDERISRAVATDLALQLGAGMTESQIALAAGQLFGQGYLLSFSRDQESQADDLGLRYMTAAGYSPRGMVQVLRILAEADKGGRPIELLATHPDPQRRLRDVERAIRDDYRGKAGDGLFEDRFERDAAPHLQQRRRAALGAVAPVGAMGFGWCPLCATGHGHAAPSQVN